MYSTREVAKIAGKSISGISYHIQNGNLKVTRNLSSNGLCINYSISQANLDDFLQNYIYSTEKRDKVAYNSGKKLNMKEFTTLTDFVSFVKEAKTIKEVLSKYQKLELKIPSLEAFVLHERAESLARDHENGSDVKSLVKKYNLTSTRIYTILKKQREF